jgi:hypothetical protein
VTGLAESYDTPNAGSGKTLSVSPYTVNDGNGGGNYTVSTVVNATGVINRANASVVVTPYSVPYDASAHTATGSVTGVLHEALSGLSLAASTHTNAGTYSDGWSFTDTTGNYNNVSGLVSDEIRKADAVVTLTSLIQTFTGAPLSPGVTTVPPGLSVSLSGAPDTATGSYSVTATVTDPNYAGVATGTFVITDSIDLTTLALNGNASLNGSVLRLTNDQGGETSSAWLRTTRPVAAGFSTSFQFRIASGSTPLADGFAFVIQSAPTGITTLGTTGLGGFLGYTGIPKSLAIEFDTFQNAGFGDPADSHVGIQSNGTNANSSDHISSAHVAGPVKAVFADTTVHSATISYDGTSLSVFLDASTTPVLSAPVNLNALLGLNGGNAIVGFTAATGASSENSDILSWTWR